MFPLIVLFSWPLVVWFVFSKYRIEIALPVAIIAGYLLLPVKTVIDLPLLPALHKHTVPVLAASLFLLTAHQLNTKFRHNRGLILRHPLANILVFAFLISPFLTVLSNPDPLFYGGVFLPGLRLYDGFATVWIAIMNVLPFYLAFKFLAYPEHQKTLVITLAIAGLIYAGPTLLEIIISPQLHRMVYGFSNVNWLTTLRGDGFRPVVFLEHGLRLSLFMSLCVLAALGASRVAPPKHRFSFLFVAAFVFTVLLLSRSLGALLITIVLAPIVVLASTRFQLWTAGIIAICILLFPMLRNADVIPTDRLVAIAQRIDADRAASLQYRFNNEDILLARANERSLLGWGGYRRSRVFDSEGRDVSVTDGTWVIAFGNGGWLRYLAQFGLLTAPLILLAFRQRKFNIGPDTAALALVSAANLIDLIPNSGQTVITWLVSGALWGRLALGRIENKAAETEATATKLQNSRYSRAHKGTSEPNGAAGFARKFEPKVRR